MYQVHQSTGKMEGILPIVMRVSVTLSRALSNPSVVPVKNILFILTVYRLLRTGITEWWARGTLGLLRDGVKGLMGVPTYHMPVEQSLICMEY